MITADQVAVGDHPGAGHPRPRRATLPGRRRRRRHVKVQPALPQLPQRGQLPVHVRGVPHPVRPRRRPREPHRRARHRITARQLPPAQHRLPGRRPPVLILDHRPAPRQRRRSAHSTRAGSHPGTPSGRTSSWPPAPASAGAITCRAVSTSRSPSRYPEPEPSTSGPCRVQLTDPVPVNPHAASPAAPAARCPQIPRAPAAATAAARPVPASGGRRRSARPRRSPGSPAAASP